MHLVYIHNTIVEWPLAHYRMGKLDCIILITRPEARGEDKDPSKAGSHPHTELSRGRFVNYQTNNLTKMNTMTYLAALQTKTQKKLFQYSKLYFSLRFGLKFQAHGNCFGKAP